MTTIRVGVTMRETNAVGYDEPRDALARDWIAFLAAALPDAAWMPLPNAGASVLGMIDRWDLDAFVLSGGDDVDDAPERLITETAIVDEALRRGLPIFGVCRGLQMLQRYFSGPLRACPRDPHVARSHPVHLRAAPRFPAPPCDPWTVNSYHAWGVREGELASPLIAAAVSDDRFVEAAVHPTLPVVAVQWHPERDRPFRAHDIQLLRQTFGLPEREEFAS